MLYTSIFQCQVEIQECVRVCNVKVLIKIENVHDIILHK
jgi:hypothetical protein